MKAGHSSDADDSIDSWEWTQGNTIISTESNPVVDLPVGTHTLSLTVTDNEGATGSDAVSIHVQSANAQVSEVTRLSLVNANADFNNEIGELKDERP